VMDLLASDEVRARLKPAIESRDYWELVLPPFAHAVAERIEQRHYQGPANDDFWLALAPRLGPYPLVAVILAHKRRMGAKALAKALKACGGPPSWGKDVGAQDIIIPYEAKRSPALGEALAGAFYAWVQGIDPERN
jgi:hypothetical protein